MLWALTLKNTNKALRLIAALGLTTLAALNTFQFLERYNNTGASAAAALSFEIMYIAAAWNIELKGRWKILANNAVVIVTGVLCSTVYNVLNHIAEEVVTAFTGDGWAVALSFIMSLLLTIPACLLLVSIHNNNHEAPSDAASSSTSSALDALMARVQTLETRLSNIADAIAVLRKHLDV